MKAHVLIRGELHGEAAESAALRVATRSVTVQQSAATIVAQRRREILRTW